MKKIVASFLVWSLCLVSLSANDLKLSTDNVSVTDYQNLFSLKDLKGRKMDLKSQLTKGPVVISFWATWCSPCLQELIAMSKYYKYYHSKGVQFIAINIDDVKTQVKVSPVVRMRKFPFLILLDPDQKIFKQFLGDYPPLTLVLDSNGRIIYKHVGYQKGDEKKLFAFLDTLLETK